ncbi:MAG TPA: thiol reductant ABC exporter subunit CydD [Gaiellaceae bacterium]|nr:thiol reductant ABC exporter subunit CydD [Gaiellaceae bacterium]
MRPVDPRLLREAPPARRFLAIAALLGLADAAAAIAQAAALGLLVAHVLLGHRTLRAVTPELEVLVAAALVRGLLAWALEAGGRLTALRVAAELRRKLLAHLLAARPAGLHETPAGELAAAAVSGLDSLDPYFARFLPQLVLSLVLPVSILVWVAWHDLASALVMALTLPLIPIFGVLVGKATQARTMRRFRTLSLLSAYFLDVVRGLQTLRAFGRGRAQTSTIAAVSDAYRRETMGTLRVGFLSALVLELAATLSTAVIAVEIGIRLVGGGIALAPALAILVLAPEYYGPLRAAAAQFHAAADGLAAASRVFELLDLPSEVAVPATPLPMPDLARVPLRLDGLELSYPGRSERAVAGVSGIVRPGERVALAGASGAGKTSLLSLLLRLRDPSGGRILAGETDAASVDPAAWRAQIAWLPQRPRLAAGRLRDALDPGGALRDEDLRDALERAAAGGIVTALPGGLDAELGERTPLSAGEIRRLALARALASARPLLVLDEPTTHLDAESAAAVRGALSALPAQVTVVFATHDEQLLALADRVIRLDAAPVALDAVA